ncbi:MAG TPA: hypothetical protein VEQ85_14995, partial [Lacipirellulaceae bacterium]|nr:hypothetical protein [Lacipirellulaceae bacterium]
MEEPRTRPGLPGDRSQAAAEKLRALRERANQALEGHRSRLGQIESQLGERVRQLAEEYTAALAPPPVDAQREDELERLRRQVEEGHAKHERFVAQLAAAREQLQAIVAKPCANCEDLSRRLAASDEEVGRLHQQLANAARAHDEDRARHEKFVEQLTAARQAITVLQHSAGESTAELRAELDAGRAAQAAAQQQLAALQVEHAAAQRDLDALRVECGEARQQSELLAQQIADERAESLALRDLALAGDSERSVAAAEVADLTARLEAASVERDDLRRDRDALKSQCEHLARARAELAASLAAAQEQATAKGSEAASLARQLATAAEEAERAAQSLAASESHRLTASQALAEAETRA